MNHARISAYLLIATGALHTMTGLVSGLPQLASMTRAGIVGTVTASPEREAIFWFLVSGVALVLAGLLHARGEYAVTLTGFCYAP